MEKPKLQFFAVERPQEGLSHRDVHSIEAQHSQKSLIIEKSGPKPYCRLISG
jgi:hypothetical protein